MGEKRVGALCLISLASAIWGQSPTDNIPLKNWDAPLRWAPPSAPASERQKGASLDAAGQTAALQFVGITPCRVMDTRSTSTGFPGAFGPPSLQGNAPRTIPIPSSACGIPSSAAYSLNFTLICSSGPVGFVAAWPDNVGFPGTSITNAFTGGVIANAAVVPAGPDGGISVMVSSIGDLVIDINGFYVAGSSGGGGTNATSVNGAAVPASATFLGSNSSSQLTALTPANATATLSPFTSTFQGVVPGSGGGTINFLRADGTWAAPPTGSGGGTNATSVNGVGIPANALFTGTNASSQFTALTAAQANAALQPGVAPGTANTAVGGAGPLQTNTGADNTGIGFAALEQNTSGSDNTALGNKAMLQNSSGGSNVAVGSNALQQGGASGNTAVGSFAMGSATVTGGGNTAVGQIALQSVTSGTLNTALGQQALQTNSTGSENTAVGAGALVNAAGSDNTAMGKQALNNLGSGNNNIAIGVQAGGLLSTGTNNIYIGSAGASSESGIMRLGGSSQTATFINGIIGSSVTSGSTVVINSSNQLGVVASSRRYKEDIRDMGDATNGLMRLRPVTFRYKQAQEGGSKPLEYGLIAEEVDEVYPELVVRNKDGQVETVQYHELAPMLLNELQKQNQHVQQQDETIRQLQAQLAALQKTMEVLQASVASNSKSAGQAAEQR